MTKNENKMPQVTLHQKLFSSFFLITVEQSMRSSNERAIFASVGQSSNPKNESVGQLYPDCSASTPRTLTLVTLK